MPTSASAAPLTIGPLIIPGMDQADFTVAFEALAAVPNATVQVIAKELAPVTESMRMGRNLSSQDAPAH